MKKSITTLTLALVASASFAQQRLPAKVTLSLTDKQILRIDSAINLGSNSMDSKSQTKWFVESFSEFYNQVRKQMVADTTKKRP